MSIASFMSLLGVDRSKFTRFGEGAAHSSPSTMSCAMPPAPSRRPGATHPMWLPMAPSSVASTSPHMYCVSASIEEWSNSTVAGSVRFTPSASTLRSSSAISESRPRSFRDWPVSMGCEASSASTRTACSRMKACKSRRCLPALPRAAWRQIHLPVPVPEPGRQLALAG